ncbi:MULTISPECIES: amidase [Microbacterium]|uniref:Asp-tRNAAsn/Glu-tRNAGln amidotransferase A subunit n=1 Tax=Microbacterium saccharophilum TaxID=1213358 RepID=A0A7Z7CX51_9MICO|nr:MULTISPECIES: amidase [Microbacterium]SFI18090.1 Asp-tRNAAsn/Glu-tRNAGln amidotransferase A subunit [Microbacterium saccharophilum]
MNHIAHDVLSATNLIEAYSLGTLTPVEVVEQLQQRASDIDGELHAWVATDWATAELAASRLRGAPSAQQPLWGVPIGVKDNIDLQGFPTRAGSHAFRDAGPARDAEVVVRLRRAGAIPIGKLATTELATLSNPPQTVNPWNGDHTPGGSSAGPAAAVASGMVPIALGTQTRGSVIRPASFTGLFGVSPTPGIVSTEGVVPNAYSIDRVGALARSAGDLALFLQSQQPAVSRAIPEGSVIGVVTDDYFWNETQPACRDAVDVAAEALQHAGYQTREVEIGLDFAVTGALHDLVEMVDFGAAHEILLQQGADSLGPFCVDLIRGAGPVSAVDYVRAQQERRRLTAALLASLDGLGAAALLTPGAPGAAPVGTRVTGSPRMSTPFTFLGLPAVAAPSVLDGEGMPVGVQLVAAPFQDLGLVALAAAIEARVGRMTQHLS